MQQCTLTKEGNFVQPQTALQAALDNWIAKGDNYIVINIEDN